MTALAGPAPAATARGTASRAAWPAERGAAFAARTSGALASGGGALVATAVAAPHLGTHPAPAVGLLVAAAAAAGTVVATLRGPGPATRRAAGAAALLGGAVLVVSPVWGLVGTAAVTAGALALVGAVLLAAAARPRTAPDADAGPWTRLLALAAGALLVSAVAVHGLAATEAGAHAVPHGSHGLLGGGSHGHHG